jgi:hypothetical protein
MRARQSVLSECFRELLRKIACRVPIVSHHDLMSNSRDFMAIETLHQAIFFLKVKQRLRVWRMFFAHALGLQDLLCI